MNFNQQLLITYECVSSIGTSLETKMMMEHFLKIFSKKTGAIVSAFWQKKEDEYKLVCGHGKKVFLDKIEPIQSAEKIFIVTNDENSKTLYIKITEGIISFLFIKNDDTIKIVKSVLHSVYAKLDTAVLACINHEKLSKINEELACKIKEEVQKNRDKDKHLLQKSRQAQMGEMISMIAHQWRQPLSAIGTAVAGLKLKQALKKYDLSTSQGREEHNNNLTNNLNKIEGYIYFLTTTIDDFRNFFKPDKQKEEVFLFDLVENALKIIEKSLEINKIKLNISNKSEKKVFLFQNEVMQVVLNLLKNAEDVHKEKKKDGAEINIEIYANKGVQAIEIKDNAGGIPENIIEHVFEPYFSTKEEKNGTGLGLYMSKIIIEEHCGGMLSVSNGPHGANFKIEFKEEK